MNWIMFVAAAAVAVFAVLVGVAFKAGADASRCGDLDGPEDDEEENEDDEEEEEEEEEEEDPL